MGQHTRCGTGGGQVSATRCPVCWRPVEPIEVTSRLTGRARPLIPGHMCLKYESCPASFYPFRITLADYHFGRTAAAS
jgi:hypothetical protein